VQELWLIRHGETDWNTEDRIVAATDLPLNATGIEQARHVGARLAELGTRFDTVYASDLARARVTAELAFPAATLRQDPRLRELDYGVFEGHRWDELDGSLAAAASHWRADPYTRRAPGGESYDDVIARFEAFRSELPPSGRCAVVSHGGTIRCVVYAAMGRPPRGSWGLEIANTAISRLRYRERTVRIVTLNDHAHLLDAPS